MAYMVFMTRSTLGYKIRLNCEGIKIVDKYFKYYFCAGFFLLIAGGLFQRNYDPRIPERMFRLK